MDNFSLLEKVVEKIFVNKGFALSFLFAGVLFSSGMALLLKERGQEKASAENEVDNEYDEMLGI